MQATWHKAHALGQHEQGNYLVSHYLYSCVTCVRAGGKVSAVRCALLRTPLGNSCSKCDGVMLIPSTNTIGKPTTRACKAQQSSIKVARKQTERVCRNKHQQTTLFGLLISGSRLLASAGLSTNPPMLSSDYPTFFCHVANQPPLQQLRRLA